MLQDFGDNRLTLTTCNPEFSAAQRLVVVALLKEPSGSSAAPSRPVRSYRLVDEAPAGWNWGELPAATVLGMGLIALGLFCRRLGQRFDPVARWLVLVPIWVAGLYVLFQVLENFLPAAA